MSWLLERYAERLSTHRRCSRLKVGVGFADLLDLFLALDVATEGSLLIEKPLVKLPFLPRAFKLLLELLLSFLCEGDIKCYGRWVLSFS